MFSIFSKKSFDYSKLLIDFLFKESNDLKIILLANKWDLLHDNEPEVLKEKTNININNEDMPLATDEIDNYLANIRPCYHYNISCKNNFNINKVVNCFHNLDLDENLEFIESKKSIKSSCFINC